jgi:ABC-2 type transport system ATP-binding protein
VEEPIPFNDPVPAPPSEPAVVVRATGLSRYFGRMHAVENLDLTVRAGEIYGFLGTNGAGKTTTIRMLMGIIKADAGALELFGEPTRRTDIPQKQRIGYVSQEQTFYPWMTCRGLGRFVGGLYPTWDAGEFERLLRVLELPPDRKASQLSGGMRLKLALALALASRPALLILDEPTSGLDPVARREFLELIKRQAREHSRTTLFSSHLIDEVERVADRVGIINHGRMRYEGDLETLRASVRRVCLPAMPILVPPLISDGTGHSAGTLHFPLSPPAVSDESPAQAAGATLPPLNAPTPQRFPPANFEVLRDQTNNGTQELVLNAPPAAWESLSYPGVEVSRLPLEDIFIALVGSGVSQI